MDEQRFWSIVGEAYRPDAVEQAEALRGALAPLKWPEVIDFHAYLEKLVAAADTRELRAAAALVNGDATELGYRNFCLGLVASGKRAYEAAMADADSLADFLEGDPLDGFGLDKVPLRVYEEKTGGSDFYHKLLTRHPQLGRQSTKLDWHSPGDAQIRASLPGLSALYPPLGAGSQDGGE